jgi:gliding motility-associated-like protein
LKTAFVLPVLLFVYVLGYCHGNNQGSQIPGGGISLKITVKNPSCTNAIGYDGNLIANGAIIISASGGTPPYIYNIHYYPPEVNGYFPGLLAGTYKTTVKDANGVTVDTSIILTNTLPQPENIGVSVNALPSSCTSSDGSFSIIESGGTAPYTFSMDGGVTFTTNNTFTNLTQGLYNLYIKDANGCMAMSGSSNVPYFSNYFFCQQCRTFVYNGSVFHAACTNEGSVLVYGQGGTPPYQYSLDGINFITVNYSSHYDANPYEYIFKNLVPGLYHLYTKDSTGASTVSVIIVPKSCNVAITYVGVDASCQQNDGSITVNAHYGNPPYVYTIDGINYQASNVFTGLGAGNYSITVSDADGGTYSIQATVYDKCPTVTADATDDTCGQKKGTITATGTKGTTPYQFSIDGVNFQTSNLFTRLTAGNYTVTIKDVNGFTSITTTIIYNDCLQLSLAVSNTTCGNTNGRITATGSNGTAPYQYSIDDVNFQSTGEFDSLAAGNYTITIQDDNGLTATEATTVTNISGPQITAGVTETSCDNTGGSIKITSSGGTAPFQYSRDNGLTLQNDSIFNDLDSGQYILLVKDANGCTAGDTLQLTAPPTPKVFLGNDTTLCAGDSMVLYAPQITGYTYLWQDNSYSYKYTVIQQGTYSVKVTNSSGCLAADTIFVGFRPLPAFSLGKDTSLCNGQIFQLNPVLPSGSYLWNTGNTTSSLPISSSGVYWLQVSGNGCTGTDSILVDFKPIPVIALGNDTTLCAGQTLLLNTASNNATYLWQDGSTQSSYSVNEQGTYSVTVTLDGCDTSGKITVDYRTKPVISLGRDTTLCTSDQLILNAAYPQATDEWQDGSTQSTYTVTRAGTYSVQVTNTCGTVIDSVNVQYEDCACKFYVPSAFTPNGDGRNDIFKPSYKCFFSKYRLRIFNRWGQVVFNSQNPDTGWDGMVNSFPQPIGTYIWEMEYFDTLMGEMVKKNGTVVLIR